MCYRKAAGINGKIDNFVIYRTVQGKCPHKVYLDEGKTSFTPHESNKGILSHLWRTIRGRRN